MLHRGVNGDIDDDKTFKVSVYAQDDAFGTASAAAISSAVEKLSTALPSSVEVIFVSSKIDPTSYDWSADLGRVVDATNETTQMKDGPPDAVFLALLPLMTTAAVKAYREANYTIPIQSTTSFRRTYILRSLGAAAEDVEGDSPR